MIKAQPFLKEWRDQSGHDQKRLAELLSEGRPNHYDPEYISSIVNGDREPSKQLIKRLCFLTGCDIGALFTFDRNAYLTNGEKDSEE